MPPSLITSSVSRPLRTAEAAFVAGVEVQEVNRALDDRILPTSLFRLGARELSPMACVFLAVYFGTATMLTAQSRRMVLKGVEALLPTIKMDMSRDLLSKEWDLLLAEKCVRVDTVSVDIRPYVEYTVAHYAQLVELRDWVVSDPAILGGIPVVKGTRIPVHDVAASLKAGHSIEQILLAYPRLSEDDVHRTALYAKTNPLRGRPSAAPKPPAGATTREDRTVPFKKIKSKAGPGSHEA
jgi:uncharacterized protein (DUF433 family)